METFLDILQEVLKGILREVAAYILRENVLENKKTTRRRTSKRVVHLKYKTDNCHPDGNSCMEKCSRTFLFIIFLLFMK
ncbi:hypothetical protein BIV60_16215 [Bacillus sp. MUM 116]|uniref:hypothetical protein n=1 Tax=Bacillus sp. MUM 116 TaxID=1678002 RepID=UPI0008F58055|nr:hypothetical protein [Bacillus sp. MUM 116]OIK12442.1 hypothetical protein BIV60_16215 [Bacillus sp. MUM 116]